MADKIENPPAFPANAPHGDSWSHRPGMTLRDYFAGQALAGSLASWSEVDVVRFERYTPHELVRFAADRAYLMADAMLTERAKREG